MSSATPIGTRASMAHAPQQLALAVPSWSRTIAPCRSSNAPHRSLRHRGADAAGDVLERGVLHRPAGQALAAMGSTISAPLRCSASSG